MSTTLSYLNQPDPVCDWSGCGRKKVVAQSHPLCPSCKMPGLPMDMDEPVCVCCGHSSPWSLVCARMQIWECPTHPDGTLTRRRR